MAQIPEETVRRINDAILRGNKIEAIKIYRVAAGCDLKDAKDFVDRLSAEIEAAHPGQIKKGSGCAGALILILCFCAVFAVFAEKTGALGGKQKPPATLIGPEKKPRERQPEPEAKPAPAREPRKLGFLKTSGRNIVDENGATVLLRGVNLGGWLVPEGYLLKLEKNYDRPTLIEKLVTELTDPDYSKKFWAAYRANYTTEADIRAIAAAGFDHVRLPMHYKLFLTDEDQVNHEGFELVDKLVGWCRAHGLWIILDLHCAPGGQTGANIDDSVNDTPGLWTEPANQERSIQFWKLIAERYKDEPVIVGYDLLNEPIKPDFNKHIPELAPFYRRATEAIRAIDQKHVIFLEGANWATHFSTFPEPFDSNVVYSFHKYWNENNPGSISPYRDVSKKHNVPLWCGEFGENSTFWYRQCTRLLEEFDTGWSFWPWKKVQSDSGCVSIKPPAGYKKIIAYSKGGLKPDPAEAQAIFDELLENLKFERCQVNRDVISALLGSIPGTIEAEDIGFLGEGVSYHDTGAKNEGNALRTGDGVDIQPTGYNVGWMEDGEWIAYKIHSAADRDYKITFRIAALSGEGRIRLLLDGRKLTEPIAIPSTGGWQRWMTITYPKASIPAGRHEVRLEIIKGGFNLDWMRFQ